MEGGIMMSADVLLTVENVTHHYKGLERPALDKVSVSVERSVALGIVGESGSGKSTLARMMIGLEEQTSGTVTYHEQDIRTLRAGDKRKFRQKIQMVFQDPLNSLNPRMTIGDILKEVLSVHKVVAPDRRDGRVREILDMVGLPAGVTVRYPHELSGGQRQRTGIARALLLNPEIIIADEPVSALDVSIQAQILNLLSELIAATGITLVMIAHDLAVVRYICENIAVMKSGRIVEYGDVETVINAPTDPYTKKLLSSVPDIDEIRQSLVH